MFFGNYLNYQTTALIINTLKNYHKGKSSFLGSKSPRR